MEDTDLLDNIADVEEAEVIAMMPPIGPQVDAAQEKVGPLSVLPGLVDLPVRLPSREKALMGRRLAAGLIDRLIPMPFLIPLFWPWALVVLAYDLGRDAQGASVGKRLLGLQTVMVTPNPMLDGHSCTAGRSLLRNLLWAGSRLCYLSLVLVPFGFALDVTGCILAALRTDGRHLGDRLGGTRVVMAQGRERIL